MLHLFYTFFYSCSLVIVSLGLAV